MKRCVVINVVGLSRRLLQRGNTPRLSAMLSESVTIQSILPAVTCSMQATYLTGRLPNSHGIVGNGWYFRKLGEVLFWRQSNRLIQGDKIWHEARRRNSAFTVANTFWWYAMNTDADFTITPRPLYSADGQKIPDCYSWPPELRDQFNREFGQFPLFHFWGPSTSIASSQWIAKAAMAIESQHRPTLQLIYLPHLDYCLQKHGPLGSIDSDLADVDALGGQLIDFFKEQGCRIMLLSEYGISPVKRVIHPNRILREAGLISLKVDLGREYLDPGSSRAFAVADHQICHIYVKDPRDISRVRELFLAHPGVNHVLDHETKPAFGLDHERSGDIVLLASVDSWFSYYWWLDDNLAPDYARTVNIHAKPGYDPCELFIDRAIRFPKLKIASILAKKQLGLRYLMDVIPLDPSLVKGSHGAMVVHPDDGPLLISTEPQLMENDALAAVDVYKLILRHLFSD